MRRRMSRLLVRAAVAVEQDMDLAEPARRRTVRSVIAGPGQICSPATWRLPDGGTRDRITTR